VSHHYERNLQGSDEMRTGDGKIVYRCLNGEPEAFGVLVDKYKASIYALVYSKIRNFHDAEDVTQDIFIKVYRNLRTLRQHDDFHWWLYSISYNYCRNWLRAKSNRPDSEFIEDQNPEEIERILSDPSMAVYQDDIVNEDIHKALNSLPKDYREVLVLYYLGGMDSVEIAKALGMSPTAIRQRLSRAREQLRGEVLAMMGATYEQQKLAATFTFHIVETVKHIKINPVSTMKGLPWGLSLATGIIITVMILNPYVSWFSQIGDYARSLLPSETKVLKIGDIPVDVVKTSNIVFLSSKMGNGKGGEPKQPDVQNALFMAPQVEGGEWKQKADMPIGVEGLSTSVADGKIYAIGGWGAGGNRSTVQVYDPTADTWIIKADMPTARHQLSTCILNGQIYAFGGTTTHNDNLPTVEEYDIVNDTWAKKADMPVGIQSPCASVVNGKIYLISGRDNDGFRANVEEYNPTTDTWTKRNKMQTARWCLSTSIVNGKIYAIGGWGGGGIVEEYTPEDWQPEQSVSPNDKLPASWGDLKGR